MGMVTEPPAMGGPSCAGCGGAGHGSPGWPEPTGNVFQPFVERADPSTNPSADVRRSEYAAAHADLPHSGAHAGTEGPVAQCDLPADSRPSPYGSWFQYRQSAAGIDAAKHPSGG